MVNYNIKTKSNETIIKAKILGDDTFKDEELKKISKNNLTNFCLYKKVQKKQIIFNCPRGITLEKYLKDKLMKSSEALIIIEQIIVALKRLKETGYMINNIVLDWRCIFVSDETKNLWFIYLPINNSSKEKDFKHLFLSLLNKFNIEDDRKNVDELSSFIELQKNFNIYEIENYIYKLDKTAVNNIRDNKLSGSGYITDKPKDYYEHYEHKKQEEVESVDEETGLLQEEVESADEETGLLQEEENVEEKTDLLQEEENVEEATGLLQEEVETADEGTGLLQEEETVEEGTGLLQEEVETKPVENTLKVDQPKEIKTLEIEREVPALQEDKEDKEDEEDEDDDDGSGETTLLVDNTDYLSYYPSLTRKSTNEVIIINKKVFRIGKEKSYVDFCISNNGAISRSHIDVITRGEHYFIKDLGSKNRSFINNRVLPAQYEVEIFNGDILKLANEEFIFKV